MWLRPRLVPLVLVAFGLLGSAAGAEVVGLLKVDEVPGDSDVPGYSDWIEVEHLNYTPPSPTNGRPDHDIEIVRSAAEGSPAVTQAFAKLNREGRVVDVEIAWVELSEEAAPTPAMQHRFTGCVLTNQMLSTQDPKMWETATFSCRSKTGD